MNSCAWIWVYVGVGLGLAELVLPGFILCFFGLSAATVGLLRFVFGEGFDLTWQLAAFSGLSIAYIALLRRWFKRALIGDKTGDMSLGGDYVGRIGKTTAVIRPPLAGRVMIGDSEWSATADREIAVGVDVKVISQDNLTMKVEAI